MVVDESIWLPLLPDLVADRISEVLMLDEAGWLLLVLAFVSRGRAVDEGRGEETILEPRVSWVPCCCR